MKERTIKAVKELRGNSVLLRHIPSGKIFRLPDNEIDDILEDIKNLR